MPDCVRDSQTVTFFVPDEARKLKTDFPVLKFGRTDAQFPEKTLCCRELEVCFRISGGGAAEDVVDGRRYCTPLPHVMFKLPGRRHTSSCPEPRHAFFFHCSAAAPELLRLRNFPIDEIFWPVEWDGTLGKIAEEMMLLSGSLHTPGVPERVDLLAWQLLLECAVRHCCRPPATPRGHREQAVRAIASYLQLHCCEEPDFDALAKRHGLSRRNFFRCWAEYYREPPARMVRRLRIRHAKELLSNTDLSVAEISARLGFRYAEYFIRAFREETGQTPLQFRRVPVPRRPQP